MFTCMYILQWTEMYFNKVESNRNLTVSQTGETVALKKVALRRLEDGIPNQALREIKALQEIEDNQHVSVRPNFPLWD